ncbi:hypothetical protein evm_005388 [Chilo suppressalis]|nr:hypothetical protein evm_005388 [Chilo suppressalis]
MKLQIVVSLFVVAAFAEPPPSNSYLPPSSGQGYPQGPTNLNPQVVAARSLEPQGFKQHAGHAGHASHGNHGSHDNFGALASGFGRNAAGHAAQGRFSPKEQGYDQNANAFGRNALEEASEPANYNFGYMVNDYQEGTDFGHHEERQEESARGEYHVVLPDGRKQTVSYEADERGFKPHITYEDTENDAAARSGGYDTNANNVRSGDHHHGNTGHHGFANGGRPSARNNGY